ncbi:UPF0175 family protein [Halomicrobium katesii]|uniref:UPF0175 family protein n=1 Tax=Halomicrobium katesii TaxID=437163 RepID=UPI000364AF82
MLVVWSQLIAGDGMLSIQRSLFASLSKSDERIAAAVALYKRERITLGDAARLAGVDRWTMRDILREHGVKLRLGLVDEDDAAYEGEAASELGFDDEDSDDEEPRAK